MPKDKIIHFCVCGAISLSVTVLFCLLKESLLTGGIAGILTSMAAGGGKEYGDSVAKGNFWDWLDVVADAAGALTGVCIGSLLWL